MKEKLRDPEDTRTGSVLTKEESKKGIETGRKRVRVFQNEERHKGSHKS